MIQGVSQLSLPEIKGMDEDWGPYALEPVENLNRIKRFELIAGIVLSICAIILFNFFPHWLGMIKNPDEATVIIPILTPQFLSFVPLLTVYWILEIIFKLVLLWQGQWRPTTRWIEFFLGLFSLYINYQILTGGPITTMSWLNLIIQFGLGISLIVGVFESIHRLYKIIHPPIVILDSDGSARPKMA